MSKFEIHEPNFAKEQKAASGINLSALAIRERSVTLFFLLAVILAGVFAYFKLGRAEDPHFTIKVFTVAVAWPGATAQEILTAPLGLAGVVPTLLLFHVPFGFNAILGLIALAGILMRNTLILIGQIKTNKEEGLDDFHAVVEATVQRSRPVVLTALAAVLAFIPLTYSVFWGSLAYTLIGGTAVGTVLTLVFLPALYTIWFRVKPTVQQPLREAELVH